MDKQLKEERMNPQFMRRDSSIGDVIDMNCFA